MSPRSIGVNDHSARLTARDRLRIPIDDFLSDSLRWSRALVADGRRLCYRRFDAVSQFAFVQMLV
jgi:hypothetical protein